MNSYNNKTIDEYIKYIENIILTLEEEIIIDEIDKEFIKTKWFDAGLKEIIIEIINFINISNSKIKDRVNQSLKKWYIYKSHFNYFCNNIPDKCRYYRSQLVSHFNSCNLLLTKNNINIYTDTLIDNIYWDLKNQLNALSEIWDYLSSIKEEHLLYEDVSKYIFFKVNNEIENLTNNKEDTYYSSTTEILNKEIHLVKIIFYNNWNLTIWDKSFKISEIKNSNEKNWILLLFTIIKLWSRQKLEVYLSKFKEYKNTYFSAFSRDTGIRKNTFKTFPSRWNKFARDNWIKLYIINDSNYLEITPVPPSNKQFHF